MVILLFCNCDLLNPVVIPGNVTHIKDSAFAGCKTLSDLTLGSGLTEIGKGAFNGCKALQNIQLPAHLKTINDSAFFNCDHLSKITLRDGVETIGKWAFGNCENLDSITLPNSVTTTGSITLPDSVTTIGEHAFYYCKKINSITIPKNVTTIEPNTFSYCLGLKRIMLPAGLTSFKDDLSTCMTGQIYPVYKKDSEGQFLFDEEGNRIIDTYVANGAIYYNSDKNDAEQLEGYNVLQKRNFLYLCKVTFDANGGKLNDDAEVPVYKTEKITKTEANDRDPINAPIHDPTRAGYKFTGWYTENDQPNVQPFNVDETAITEDTTLYAGWKFDPDALGCHPLTVTGGTVTVKYDGSDVTNTLTVTTDATTGKKTYDVPEGAEVTVKLDKNLIPKGNVFDGWSTGKFSLPLGQDYKAETITFTMNTMSSDADIAAQYRDASIEDDGPGVLGTAAIIGTAAVGTAVLGYQAYSLGAEFAGKLMALPYFPSNRSALAMMLWEDAGKPMPESELLYPDVEQEEQDMDLQHAARWAMENELIPDLNDEGTAPEEMKFFPANPVSKLDVLNAWQKAQELKQNA